MRRSSASRFHTVAAPRQVACRVQTWTLSGRAASPPRGSHLCLIQVLTGTVLVDPSAWCLPPAMRTLYMTLTLLLPLAYRPGQ